jgi:hypothetical protein
VIATVGVEAGRSDADGHVVHRVPFGPAVLAGIGLGGAGAGAEHKRASRDCNQYIAMDLIGVEMAFIGCPLTNRGPQNRGASCKVGDLQLQTTFVALNAVALGPKDLVTGVTYLANGEPRFPASPQCLNPNRLRFRIWVSLVSGVHRLQRGTITRAWMPPQSGSTYGSMATLASMSRDPALPASA